jgi:hypothetical protein
MEEAFCVETLEDALARHGKPDIFNRIEEVATEPHLPTAFQPNLTSRSCGHH